MRNLIAAIGLMTLSPNGVADERPWFNVGPFENEDTRIYLDFKVKRGVPSGGLPSDVLASPSYEVSTDPLWVNVHRGGLDASDRVQVMLINYYESCYRGRCYSSEEAAEYELEFAEEGRFTGLLKPIEIEYQLNDGYAITRTMSYDQDIVVWINGALIKDPMTDQNFRFDLLDTIYQL